MNGMGVTLNFDASQVEPNVAFDPVPSGWYKCIIEDSKMEPTSNGGAMMALTMKIIEGDYANRKLFDRLNLQNANPQAVEIAYKTLSAISRAAGVMQVQNSTQLHNIPMWVKAKYVGPEKDKSDPNKVYDPKNDVKGYDHISADHTAPLKSDAVTAGGVAGAPQGTPPWAAGAAGGAPAAPAAGAPPVAQQPPYSPPHAQVQVGQAAQPWANPGNAPVAAAPSPAAASPAPGAPAGDGAPPWATGASASPAPAAAAAPPPPAQAAPPPPQATGPQMLPAANGVSYDSFIKQGWTDALLVQHGMMAQPAAAAPPPPQAAPAPATAPPPPGAAGTAAPPWATGA